jgi:hypothetical protein
MSQETTPRVNVLEKGQVYRVCSSGSRLKTMSVNSKTVKYCYRYEPDKKYSNHFSFSVSVQTFLGFISNGQIELITSENGIIN